MEEPELEHAFHIANLIVRHLKGEASIQDQCDLHQWINSNDGRYELFEMLTNTAATNEALRSMRSFSAGAAWLRFLRSAGKR